MVFLRGIPIVIMVGRVRLMGSECKWGFFLYFFIHISISIVGVSSTSRQLEGVRKRLDYYKKHAIKSIQVFNLNEECRHSIFAFPHIGIKT